MAVRVQGITKVKRPGLASWPQWLNTLPQVFAKIDVSLSDWISVAAGYVGYCDCTGRAGINA